MLPRAVAILSFSAFGLVDSHFYRCDDNGALSLLLQKKSKSILFLIVFEILYYYSQCETTIDLRQQHSCKFFLKSRHKNYRSTVGIHKRARFSSGPLNLCGILLQANRVCSTKFSCEAKKLCINSEYYHDPEFVPLWITRDLGRTRMERNTQKRIHRSILRLFGSLGGFSISLYTVAAEV